MRKIIVPNPPNGSLIAQLSSLHKTFLGAEVGEKLDFDLSGISWGCPLLILPISAYINDTGSSFTMSEDSKPKSYLDTIKFPGGINSVSSFEALVQKQKTYIPISLLQKENKNKERLETMFSQMIYKTLVAAEGTQSAIYYPMSELVGNIFEHSGKDEGYIFGQFYKTKDYLDICIVDCGRGLAGSYKEKVGLVFSDEEAILEVLRGHSTKSDVERGYGIRSSKRIVCEALGGGFILISGSSALVSIRDSQKLVDLPNFGWHGLIVSYRIPRPKLPVDISPYLE